MLHFSQITVDCLERMECLLSYCVEFNLKEPVLLGKLVPYVQEIHGSNPKTSCRAWYLLWL
jgi:hypothetical protein